MKLLKLIDMSNAHECLCWLTWVMLMDVDMSDAHECWHEWCSWMFMYDWHEWCSWNVYIWLTWVMLMYNFRVLGVLLITWLVIIATGCRIIFVALDVLLITWLVIIEGLALLGIWAFVLHITLQPITLGLPFFIFYLFFFITLWWGYTYVSEI